MPNQFTLLRIPSRPDTARILKSKKTVGRDKDNLHITLIKDFLRCRREVQGPQGAARTASPKQD